MIDCPDCGKSFAGRSCKCGYSVSLGRNPDAPTPLVACCYQNCPEPAITRDKLNAPLCKTHWNQSHHKEGLRVLNEWGIQPGVEGRRYAISKFSYELARKMGGQMDRFWAGKLIEKKKAGQYVPENAIELAKKALRIT